MNRTRAVFSNHDHVKAMVALRRRLADSSARLRDTNARAIAALDRIKKDKP